MLNFKKTLTSITLFNLITGPVVAQTSKVDLGGENTSNAEAQKFERVEVTGSNIRKIDIEGVAPLDTISSDEFIKSGSIEIGQVLREDPAFEAVYGNAGHVRFRGQHAGNVLILLNGLRMPKLGGGHYTTVRNIPTSAINRVEMLKDGGSAVYGSDAMSGVMNFITKTDFDGANIGLSTTVPENGWGTQNNIEGTFGKNFSRGNFMAVVQVEDTQALNEVDLGSVNSDPGDVRVKTSNINFGDRRTGLKVGPQCGDAVCETDGLLYAQSRPENRDISGLLTGAYTVGETKFSVLGLYNRKTVTELGNPLNLDWRNNSSAGGANNAIDFSSMADSAYKTQLQDAGVVNNGFIDVQGSLVDELGDYIKEVEENNYNFQAGASGYIGLDWDWKVQSSYSIADFKETVVSGEADQDILRQMFRDGRLNLLAPQGSKDSAADALINPVYRNTGTMLTSKAVFSGEIVDLSKFYEGGRSISVALGAEFQQEAFEFNNDQALVDGSAINRPTRNFSGKRDVRSAMMEFYIAPVESVEIQVAGRFDSYSDVGTTANPKMAFSYRPVKELLFRGSTGTGFRAPGITDIYAGEEFVNTSVFDAVYCARDRVNGCRSNFQQVTTYTTNDTKPEEGLTYSMGTVFQPFKKTTISLDQWNFEGENTLTGMSTSNYLDIENRFGTSVVESIGAKINRDADGKIQNIRHPRVVNLGNRELRGFDLEADTTVDLGGGFDLLAGSGVSFIFERSEQRFSFEERQEYADTWKNRAYLGLTNDYHFFRMSALTVSKQVVGRGDNQNTLPSYTEFDMTYGYTTSWGGRFNVTLKNLANTRAPANPDGFVQFGRPDLNYSSFSPLRRRVYLAYSQNF